MAKSRPPIPKDLAADVCWLSDSTCCICMERDKGIQFHHIDEDPTNNNIENLAVLCSNCHDKAHKKGGVTRRMDSTFVALSRDNWHKTVAWRRKEADERDVERRIGKNSKSNKSKDKLKNKSQHIQLREFPYGYIKSLPTFKSDLLQHIQQQKSDGTTLDIIEANSHYENVLKGILITLATFYSPEYFKDQSPQEFFSEIISARDRFHFIIAEQYGPHTGGTLSGICIGLERIKDIEYLIEAMVYGLLYPKGSYDDIDYDDWQQLWRDSGI